MTDWEVCPKCQAKFEARECLVYGGIPVLLAVVAMPGVSTRVKCPGCGHLFSAVTVRFFGVLTANLVRLVLLLGAFAFLIFFVLAH
jgi:hypothetical protein